MHVTQLLKKETEAETPEGKGGGGEKEEAKPSVWCPFSGCRRVGSVAEPEREPGLEEAEPGWALRCSSPLHLRRARGRKRDWRHPLPPPRSRSLRPQSYSGKPLNPIPFPSPPNLGGESTLLIPVATQLTSSLN